MKRFAVLAAAVVVLCMSSGAARASWGSLTYSGYQPWWNIFAHRNKCMTCEEERLQRFWHDYYDALHHYYQPWTTWTGWPTTRTTATRSTTAATAMAAVVASASSSLRCSSAPACSGQYRTAA